jgi:glycosyltransferase involved in cell wall biosynthesis
MAKRILIFSLTYYPKPVSGSESAIKDTTDRIDPSDIEFELITIWFDRTQPQTERIGNVLVHRIGFGPLYLSKMLFIPFAALTARRLHRLKQFDAIWAMMTYMLLPVVLLRWYGVRLPYVLSLQDGDSYEHVFERARIKPVLFLLRYGFQHATIIQAISTYLASWPKKLGYTGPVELIYDGANPNDIHNTCTEADIARIGHELGRKEGEVILMNTARLVEQKAPDVTIRALTLLPENVRLVLVGDGVLRDDLEKLAKELGVEQRVMFTGRVDRSEVTTYRRAADIFVGASRTEGLGHAFLSAMASPLPVIATQVGGIADFLFDAKRNPDTPTTGWAVDPDRPEQIAEAVQDIIAHPEKVRQVTNTARAMVVEKYDWDVIAKDMRTRVFARILNETRA